MINEEGGFPRLLELILCRKDDDAGLHRLLLELLYEMSRIQRIRTEELGTILPLSGQLDRRLTCIVALIEDDLILYLFQIIEELSDDVNDPYHYPVIRVLVCLFIAKRCPSYHD